MAINPDSRLTSSAQTLTLTLALTLTPTLTLTLTLWSAYVRGVGEHEWGPSSVRRCAIACELGWKVGHYGRRVMIYKKLYDFKRSSVLAARAKAGERAYLF